MSIEVKEFIKDPKYTNIKTYYKETFVKVGELETAISNLDNVYLPLTGGTLTGSLNINTTSIASDSFTITDTTANNIRVFTIGDSLIYSYKILSSGQVSAERKFEVSNIFEYSGGNNQFKIVPADITIKTSANNKFENKLGSSSYMNFYNNDSNYLYMGTTPNTSGNMIDWIVAGFRLQLNGGSLYKQVNGFTSTLTSTSYGAQFNSAGGNSNSVSINGTNITWRGAQKASYSNPNYDTVDFRINQNGFDYTGNWYSTQSATNPVQLRIYSGANYNLLYISHSVLNGSNTSISITDETNDTTISMRCDNGSNYSSVGIGGGNINLNKGLNNSFTHFSAGSGNLETSKDYTGFRFNLTDTSKTKGLTAFKANSVNVDFTIEGFHNIINDKFTLSDTYDTTATGTLTQDEINWIDANSKDILALILDIKRSGSGTDVVTRAEYNALLDAYNDLAERLNQFLLTTGNVTPTPTGNFINITLTEDNLATSIEIGNQHANDDYTINWGDNTNSLSDDGNIYHEYSSPGDYIITLTANNEDSAGILAIYGGEIGEVCLEDIDLLAPIGTKITIDNSMLYNSSGTAFWWEDNEITEIHIKEHCIIPANNDCLINDCSNLTKVIIDTPIISTYDGGQEYYLIKDCPNLTELYLTNSTLPNILNGTLFNTIPNNIIIYVPNALVNDYQVAFPDYIDHIQGY